MYYKDENGYAVNPVSLCCGERLCIFIPTINKYVPWSGWMLSYPNNRVRCIRCNREYEISDWCQHYSYSIAST